MVMIFANTQVREYLLEHGFVYTFRTYDKKTPNGIRPQIGSDWATDKRNGKKIADINVTPVTPIDVLNMGRVLTKYARQSGLHSKGAHTQDTVSKWARTINILNPNKGTAGWLYKVETVEAET